MSATAVWIALSVATMGAEVAVDEQVAEAEARRIATMERAKQAAVAVFAPQGNSGGSGVLISADGYAVTNFHVVAPAGPAMKCGLPDGELYDAVIVGIDPTGDVALIQLLGRDDFPFAELADSDTVAMGDDVFAVGNPFMLATDFQPTVTYGIVSGVHRYQYPSGTLIEYTDCIQTDASINPGNSGGPLFNAEGNVIGINGRISVALEDRDRVNAGVGYAISINQVKNFLWHLKSGRIVDHATLGAVVAHDADGNVVVSNILEESDAYRRGLDYDDEIVALGGRAVRTVNGFKNVLGIFPSGWQVPLVYRRDGITYETRVRLRDLHAAGELVERISPRRVPRGDEPGDEGEEGGEPEGGEPEEESPEPEQEQEKNDEEERESQPVPDVRAMMEATMPDAVQEVYESRRGYANFHFQREHVSRLVDGMRKRSDLSTAREAWILKGETANGAAIEFALSDEAMIARLPAGESIAVVDGDLSDSLDPPASGGMLAALGLWRAWLVDGDEGFDRFEYLGRAPVGDGGEMADVARGLLWGVSCQLYFAPDDQRLVLLEMWPANDVDPCELWFAEESGWGGYLLPQRVEVRHGDNVYAVVNWNAFDVRAVGEDE